MQHSPAWEANRFEASQEVPHVSRNPKVYYRTHNCPQSVSILSQLILVHTNTSHFLNIHLNIIFPSMLGSPQWSLSFRCPHQNPTPASLLPHPRYSPRPSPSSLCSYPKRLGEQYRAWRSSLWSFLHSPFTSFLLGPNILLHTLFSNILSRCSSINVSDQVSHPYKTTGNIIVLYIFKFNKNAI
jgi:hypothetical protein